MRVAALYDIHGNVPALESALAGLPPNVRVDLPGLGPVLFCHGSPRSDEDIVTAVSDPERVAPMLAGVDEAIVVSGHTHVQSTGRLPATG